MSKILLSFICICASHIYAQDLQWQIIASEGHASFRAMSIVNDQITWVAGSQGTIGKSLNGGKDWTFSKVEGHEKDQFRSLFAFDGQTAVIANIGSPGIVLQTSDGGLSWQEVYKNDHPEIFFDGMDFWDANKGIIYGDPIDGNMLLLKTEDGGKSWQEIMGPALDSGEASFAASNSGINCLPDGQLFISSSGIKSKLWHSDDAGKSWKSISSPMLDGKGETGIYSFDIQNEHIITVGGDYTQETGILDHIYISNDKGVNWQKPTIPTAGYRECVVFIEKGKALAIGPTGMEISKDYGQTWAIHSKDKGYHIIAKSRNGNRIMAAGANGKIALVK